jgi:hypothetical protein
MDWRCCWMSEPLALTRRPWWPPLLLKLLQPTLLLLLLLLAAGHSRSLGGSTSAAPFPAK